MKRHFGLIGFPLSHSFSPSYFAKKFEKEGITDAIYQAKPIESIDMVEALFENHTGLNVTIPYKEVVFPFLDEIDEAASLIGAVNTIKLKMVKPQATIQMFMVLKNLSNPFCKHTTLKP